MKEQLNIFFPFLLPWNQCADFQKQTVARVCKNNRCIVYLASDTSLWFHAKKEGGALFLYPMHNPGHTPFIKLINYLLAYIITGIHFSRVDVVWLFNSELSSFFRLFSRARVKLYDIVDVSDPDKMFTALSRSTLVTANSHTLVRMAGQLTDKPVTLVPQGFDQTTLEKKTAKTPSKHTKPTVVYIGSINFRFDFNLMEEVVKKNTDVQFVFWGPVQYLNKTQDMMYKTKERVRTLCSYPNTSFGQSDRRGTMRVLTNAIVGIIPYNDMLDFNRSAFPMKLLEYFWAGLPVLSTNITELTHYPGLVFCSSDPNDWTNYIQKRKHHLWTTHNKTKAKRVAMRHAWRYKIERILQLIHAELDTK